ncbi:hypothetical protein MAP00_004580 [Monascus purpureus]|nr:hypothetical protein MAP00_004580 [Monascus purpureus]
MARPTPSFPCSTKEPYGSLESIRSLTPPAAAADIVLGGVSAVCRLQDWDARRAGVEPDQALVWHIAHSALAAHCLQ